MVAFPPTFDAGFLRKCHDAAGKYDQGHKYCAFHLSHSPFWIVIRPIPHAEDPNAPANRTSRRSTAQLWLKGIDLTPSYGFPLSLRMIRSTVSMSAFS